MKTIKLIAFFAAMIASYQSMAVTLTISGKVTDNGSGKSGVMVIWQDSASMNLDTAYTTGNGTYSLTLNTGTATSGFAFGTIVDCNGKTVWEDFFYAPRQGTSYPNQDFIYCTSTAGPYSATVSGMVSNLPPGGTTVYVDTLGGVFSNFTQAVNTSSPGYSISFHVYNDPQDIWVHIIDCKNDTITQKVTATRTKPTVTRVDFNYCKTVTGPAATVSGMVYTGAKTADAATVLLIEKHNGFLRGVDTAKTQRGYYSFVIPDSTREYLVKAWLDSLDSLYANYLPTYSDTTTKWSNGKLIPALSPSVTRDINLVGGSNPGGFGFIAGKAIIGANRAVGDPLEGVLVMLYNANGPVSYTYSDKNGDFQFEDLAMGTYTVVPEVMGLASITTQVDLTSGGPSESNVRVSVNNKEAKAFLEPNSIEDFASGVAVRVYPNPTKSEINLQLDFPAVKIDLNVVDLSGKVEISQQFNSTDKLNINVEHLTPGTYILFMDIDGQRVVSRITKL